MESGSAAYNFTWGNSPEGPGGCSTGASFACPNTDYNFVTRNITYMNNQFRWVHHRASPCMSPGCITVHVSWVCDVASVTASSLQCM
jgi:hypothetical protein